MEDKILELLNSKDASYSVEEIESNLGIESVEDLKELLKVLNKMEEEYQIKKKKKNKYMLFDNSNLKIGK